MEAEGVEPSSSQGTRRAFYMLRCDLDCRAVGWLASGPPTTLGAFVSLVVNTIIRASAACLYFLIRSAAHRPGKQWQCYPIRIKQPWRSYTRQLLFDDLFGQEMSPTPGMLTRDLSKLSIPVAPSTRVFSNRTQKYSF